MIHIDSNGGRIGRFNWLNTDTRRTCSSWTFWGDWWWDRAGERSYEPACGTGGMLLQNPPWAGGEG